MTQKKHTRRGFAVSYNLVLGLALFLYFSSSPAQEVEADATADAAAAKSVLTPRQFSAVAHDSIHHQSLLFGGTTGSQRFNDTWLLGASGWKQQSPKTNPGARISSAAAYDGIHNQFVLFGGRVKLANPEACLRGEAPQRLKNEYLCGDTWIFSNGNWIRKAPSIYPSPREGHAMAFDAARRQVILFGGTTGNSSTPLNDTWLWDGNNWRLANSIHRPPPRSWHSMAYDPIHHVVVLFGGDSGSKFLNDTWIWDGRDWHAAHTQLTPPGLRTNAGLDYDSTTGKVVLFSGSAWSSHRTGSIATDAWSWDGSQWKKLATSKFELTTSYSKLNSEKLEHALVANGSPTYLWSPEK